jgi:hypothetical protein
MALFQQQITFTRLDDTLLSTEMADAPTDNAYSSRNIASRSFHEDRPMVTLSAGGKAGIHQYDWLKPSPISGNGNFPCSFRMMGY